MENAVSGGFRSIQFIGCWLIDAIANRWTRAKFMEPKHIFIYSSSIDYLQSDEAWATAEWKRRISRKERESVGHEAYVSIVYRICIGHVLGRINGMRVSPYIELFIPINVWIYSSCVAWVRIKKQKKKNALSFCVHFSFHLTIRKKNMSNWYWTFSIDIVGNKN